MAKFRKKPVEVEAIQFVEVSHTRRAHGTSVEYNDSEIATFMNQILSMCTAPEEGNPAGRTYLEIPTLEGVMQANVGDWIIKGVNGEFYPCKPDIFAKTYNAAEVGEAMNGQQIEQEIQAKGKTAARVTPADIEAEINSEHYFTAEDGVGRASKGQTSNGGKNPVPLSLLTFCVLVLRNGFTVTGESACASPENFDAEIGRKIARQNAIAKVWPLMGFRLRDKLSSVGG